MEEKKIRINRYLSEAGVCSRRKADEYIAAGWVQINGVTAQAGEKAGPGDRVYVKGNPVTLEKKKVVLAFYKPRGLVCSNRGQGAATVAEYLQYPIPLYYVGRLDKDSEGLLLLTNDGDLANAVCRAGDGHEKEYEVTVNRPVTAGFLNKMAQGVPILDTVTSPCQVKKTGEKTFRIILTQGLNRQIRRMCQACGYSVRKLKRIRVMNITLEGLAVGQYRELEEAEHRRLNQLLGLEQ